MIEIISVTSAARKDKETVEELVKEHNSLVSRTKSFSSRWTPYRRRGTFYRALVFFGIPLLVAIVGTRIWQGLSSCSFTDLALEHSPIRVVILLVTLTLVGFVAYTAIDSLTAAFSKYIFLPLRDRKAKAELEDRIAYLSSLCEQADADRERLQPVMKEFDRLGLVIKRDIGGNYKAEEKLCSDRVKFVVKIRFTGQIFAREYDVNSLSSYPLVQRKVAERWMQKHCLDNIEEVLEKFNAELEERY